MLKTHNKNFIFGLERRKFKSYIGLPLFSLFIFFFLVSFTSGESYADCSVYGTCQETQTDVSFAGGGSGSGGITTEVDPLSIHNNTYAGYYALLDKLGVANYVGYNLGASGFDSVWGARDGSQCNGNYFDSCSGDATPCSSFLIDSECQMQTGCYYDYDLSQCAGTSQSCDTFSSASSCQQQQGCTANTPSCNVFTDQTSCETKPGECSWDLIPETYDLQYKTQSFFNFSRPIHATQVNFKTQVGAPFFTMNGLSFMEENSATLLEINRNTPYARLLFDTPSGAVFNLEYPNSTFYKNLKVNGNLYADATYLTNLSFRHNDTYHVIYPTDGLDKVCIGNSSQCDTPSLSHKFVVIGGANITGDVYLDNVAYFNSLTGNAIFNKNITALYFLGDGSRLANISSYNSTYAQWAYNQTSAVVDNDSMYFNLSANNIATGTLNNFSNNLNVDKNATIGTLMVGTNSLVDSGGAINWNTIKKFTTADINSIGNGGMLNLDYKETTNVNEGLYQRAGLYSTATFDGSGNRANVYSAKYFLNVNVAGTVGSAYGFDSQIGTNIFGGTVTNLYGARVWARKIDSRNTVTNTYGMVADLYNGANSGGVGLQNLVNVYGFRVLPILANYPGGASNTSITTKRYAFYQDGVNDFNLFAGTNSSWGYTTPPTAYKANYDFNGSIYSTSAVIGTSAGNTTINSTGITTTGNLKVLGNVSLKRAYWNGYDNSTQSNPSASNANVMNISNNADFDNYGIYVVGNQNLTFGMTGDYLCIVSPEFTSTGAPADLGFWMQKNGVDVAWSNSRYSIDSGKYIAPAIPFQFDIENPATDNIRFMWYSSNTNAQIVSVSGLTSPTRPSVPGVILNCQKISELTP